MFNTKQLKFNQQTLLSVINTKRSRKTAAAATTRKNVLRIRN
jgi:hypothetical protein